MSIKRIRAAVIEGDADLVEELVEEEIEEGTDPIKILNNGLVEGMNEVGSRFKTGEYFLPEVLMSATAMQAGNDLLKPLLVGIPQDKKGTIVIGTVKGDLHDIGKKIVGMMLEGAGYEVIDLGIDVDPERFIGALRESKADAVGMSAMLTTTMTVMQDVIAEMDKEEEFKDVKRMIGGAPVTQKFGDQIGARFSFDASSAVDLANELLGG